MDRYDILYRGIQWAMAVGIMDVVNAGWDSLYDHNFLYSLESPQNAVYSLVMATGLMTSFIISDAVWSLYESGKLNELMEPLRKLRK
jgi:hypothetical protein